MWWRGTTTFSHKGTKHNGTFVMLIVLHAGCIEIGLEQAPLVFFSFEHVKSLLIMGPNNTKNSS